MVHIYPSCLLFILVLFTLLACFTPKAIANGPPIGGDVTTIRQYYLKNDLLWNTSIDYTPYKDHLKAMVSTNSSSCHDIPPSSVIVVYVNEGLIPFVLLQKKSMVIGGVFDCLKKIFVVVCLDPIAFKLCKENHFDHCVQVNLPISLPRSEFAEGAYHFLTWIKQELMYEALKVVNEVFLFDADVLIFKNPFHETRIGRHDNGTTFPFLYDIRYQRNNGRGRGCAGTVNSGQVWLRNTTTIQRYFTCVLKMKEQARLEVPEQEFSTACAEEINVSRCVLNPNTFTMSAHTGFNRDTSSKLRHIVTYHSCGGQRGLDNKVHRMNAVMKAYQSGSDEYTIGGF